MGVRREDMSVDADLGATRLLRTAIAQPRWDISYTQAVAIADLAPMAATHGRWGTAGINDGINDGYA